MNITPRVPGYRPPLYIKYKYNSLKVLRFIATEGGGSTEPGLIPIYLVSLTIILMLLFYLLLILVFLEMISMNIM